MEAVTDPQMAELVVEEATLVVVAVPQTALVVVVAL